MSRRQLTHRQAEALLNLYFGRSIAARWNGREWVVKTRRAAQANNTGDALCSKGLAAFDANRSPRFYLTERGRARAAGLTNPLSGDRAGCTPVVPLSTDASGPS